MAGPPRGRAGRAVAVVQTVATGRVSQTLLWPWDQTAESGSSPSGSPREEVGLRVIAQTSRPARNGGQRIRFPHVVVLRHGCQSILVARVR